MKNTRTAFEILDFHTHPFIDKENNICAHADFCDMNADATRRTMQGLGISTICGSVLTLAPRRNDFSDVWARIRWENDTALRLREYYGDFYVPGFHVHPDYVEESIREIHRMRAEGVRLIGELCPYLHGWSRYSSENFSRILEEAELCGMVVNLHSEDEDDMDLLVQRHSNLMLVAAHPGEHPNFMRHLERMKMSKKYYLDLSGTGLFRHGMLRHGIDAAGAERFLFGSDFPTCNPSMFVGGVLLDDLLTDEEKEQILSKNAKKLLRIS